MLRVENISFAYQKKRLLLNNVNLSVHYNERIALVGPSGYGKSTLAKVIAGYLEPICGSIYVEDKSLKQYTAYRPVQLIFQHPEKALNPRWKVGRSLYEAWDIPQSLLDEMGIEEDWLTRWPNELSGGQLQRLSILRALSPETRVLIADEITASLDPITQAQLWQVILREVECKNMSLITITHNRSLAQRISHRIVEIKDINHRNIIEKH